MKGRRPARNRSQPARRPSPGSAGQPSRRPPPRSGPKGLGGERVEGRQAVRELLLARRRKVREVVMVSGMDHAPILDDIAELAREARVPLRTIGRSRFEALARTDSAQGVLAEASPLRGDDLERLVATTSPFLVAFDGITDPGNLGALLRSAECSGVSGVILPRHRSAHITPTVTKSAAGAVEHLRLCSVAGLPAALARLGEAGIWVVGLDEAGGSRLDGLDLSQPTCLVLGAEGRGLSRLVRERCDALAALPLRGRLGSLNVAAAGAIAFYEVVRQRT